MHGLSAISVFGERIGVRLLIFSGVMIVGLAVVLISSVLGMVEGLGWTLFALAALFFLILQSIAVIASFTFSLLSARHAATFIPIRDYRYFIADDIDLADTIVKANT